MSGGQILLTGGAGQVGLELQRLSAGMVAPDRQAFDITDAAQVDAMIASRPWDAVINCAAYTAVDKAETDVAEAWRLNAAAPAHLAAATRRHDIPMIQVSTDFVFDGQSTSPYRPTDVPAPLGVYGASKLAGEIAVAAANPRHAVVRTAWVISPHRTNFVKTMLRLATQRETLGVVADQHGAPTSAADLAVALVRIADALRARETARGTWHFTNAGDATWYDLAVATFDIAGRRGAPVAAVTRLSTADYPTPARRPAYSRLDTAAFEAEFGILPRPWRDALEDIMTQLIPVPDMASDRVEART